MEAKKEKRPIDSGCAFQDIGEMGKVKACRSAATHVIHLNKYDERTGTESLWWSLRCQDHLEDEAGIELHQCDLFAPVHDEDNDS